jgi:hypothetical protein
MKTLLILLGTAVTCALGYWAEPKLRPHITLLRPAASQKALTPADTGTTAALPATDHHVLFPDKVTLKSDVEFSDQKSGLKMTMTAGSEVRLLRVEGGNAIVRPGETEYSILVPIKNTDFEARFGGTETTAADPAPDTEPASPEPDADPMPDAGTDADSETEPMPDADSETEPMPDTDTETEPMPDPDAQPESDTESDTPLLAPKLTDIVEIMKFSIRNGGVKEFKIEDVLEWTAGPEETVDGELFQTGNLSYKAETLFGVKTIQAKALIRDGQVQRWIWPKSGVEIP